MTNVSQSLDEQSELFDTLSLSEMKNVIDLIRLYSEVNPQVIKDRPSEVCKDFRSVTNVILDIIETLKSINV